MSRKEKAELLQLLQERDLARLDVWVERTKKTSGLLTSFLSEPNQLLRNRAVEALGRATSARAAANLEAVRDLIRRLLWSMNEDSGGFNPNAPEAIGEILANAPALIDEFGEILSSFIRKPPFEASVHCAIVKMARVAPSAFAGLAGELAVSMLSADPSVRGNALSALASIDAGAAAEAAKKLENDNDAFTIFNPASGEIETVAVNEIARKVLNS